MIERKRFLMPPDSIDLAVLSDFPDFHPKGEVESKPEIIPKQIKAEDIHRLCLVQNWYWNEKKKRLEIWLVATAPLQDIKNENNEFQYVTPLFYRRTDD